MKIQLWRELLDPYDLAVKELITKFTHLQYEHVSRGLYCPIEQVTGRVKSITSILDKLNRKQIPLERVEELEDIAGIRIICQFKEDIEKVASFIKARSDMEVKDVKNYVDNEKESGYRSYHLIIYYTVRTMHGDKRIQAEIQIRTLGMNFWSTIEHSLQYKYRQNIPKEVSEKLYKAAQTIVQLDREMSQVRDEIMDAQTYQHSKANMVSEILTTMQNLYRDSNAREMERIQAEFYDLYMEDDLKKLERFHRSLDILAEGKRAQEMKFTADNHES